jgi:hypothetical protein
MLIIVLLIIYAVSVYGSYKYMQIAHSKNGIWGRLEPDFSCLFMTVMPIFNSVFSILYLFGDCYRYKPNAERKSVDLSKFYKVSK